jgi:hypothetical protein
MMDSLRVEISTTETLRLWWDRATAETPDPKPPMPTVDFTTHMVLLVSAGRSNPGDRIRVDSVGVIDRRLLAGGVGEVWFAVVRTVPDCNPIPGVSYPIELVRVPKAEGRIEWWERVATCPEREAG